MLDQMTDREKTAYITQKVIDSLDPRNWFACAELRIGVGYGKDSEQRLDVWATQYSKGNLTRCYEVKVSRGDFLSELKKPLKKRSGLRYANEFWFIMPEGIGKIEEIPCDTGLITVNNDGVMNVVIPAPYRDINVLPRNFIASFLRRFDKERLYNYLKNISTEEFLAATSNVMLEKIEEHIEMWQSDALGNREVPDKIIKALISLRDDTLDELIKRKIYK